MNDIDVGVPPYHGDRACSAAEEAGWRRLTTREVVIRPDAGAVFRNGDGRVARLHVAPSPNVPSPSDNWDSFWRRSAAAVIGGTPTRVPSPADIVVLASIDGARANSGAGLRWITDSVAVLVATQMVDWDVVVSEAQRHHASLLLGEALHYLGSMLDIAVPPEVHRALGAAHTTRRDRVAHRLSVTTPPRAPSAAELLGRFVWVTSDVPVSAAMRAAPGYLQAVLGVDSGPAAVGVVARKLVKAFVRPSPAPALPSLAGPPRATAPAVAEGP
jgi:hypothetical protein